MIQAIPKQDFFDLVNKSYPDNDALVFEDTVDLIFQNLGDTYYKNESKGSDWQLKKANQSRFRVLDRYRRST